MTVTSQVPKLAHPSFIRPGSVVPSAEGNFASQAPVVFPARRPVDVSAVAAPALREALGDEQQQQL